MTMSGHVRVCYHIHVCTCNTHTYKCINMCLHVFMVRLADCDFGRRIVAQHCAHEETLPPPAFGDAGCILEPCPAWTIPRNPAHLKDSSSKGRGQATAATQTHRGHQFYFWVCCGTTHNYDRNLLLWHPNATPRKPRRGIYAHSNAKHVMMLKFQRARWWQKCPMLP